MSVTIGASTKQSLVGGGNISFPMSQQSQEALSQLKQGKVSFVSLYIDIEKEKTLVSQTSSLKEK